MIKEKHEKGPDSASEEPGGSSDKESVGSSDTQSKKEDDSTSTNNCPKREQGRPITKNGGIVGSINPNSLHTSNERKCEADDTSIGSIATEATSLPHKTAESLEDLSSDTFGITSSSSTPSSHPPAPDGVQPLPSNVINKQSSNMEVHYMQQQSQIFVFTTMMANAGAEEVIQGHYQSIIAYHCAQPGTKKYLEKNPLKVNQFNRQGPPWMNNLNLMKNKGCTRSPGLVVPKGQPPLDTFLTSDGLDEMVGLTDSNLPWDQKNNHHLEGLEGGVKVPDENLTPEQRQHREEQLATVRKLQWMLFPENQGEVTGPGDGSELSHATGMPDHGPGGPLPHAAQIEWQKLQQQYYDDHRTKMKGVPIGARGGPLPCGGIVPIGPPSQPSLCQSGPRGVGDGMGMGPGSNGPPGAGTAPGPRLQGPPPPYHQTQRSASVPVALPSPNPTSPNNPTSNLSLPSPRASSALNSPAEQTRPPPFPLTRHMNTGASPTSQGSPTPSRPIPSNPGTPVSSHLSPSVSTTSAEATTPHQASVDGMFGRTLQSMAQQKQQMGNANASSNLVKEPNLMPVPSPQQIQYLNTFEGQELIIQKQPNTSLKEDNVISPPVMSTTIDGGFPPSDLTSARVSGPNTPTTSEMGRFPPTPGVPSDSCRFQIPSPHTPNTTPGDKQQRLGGPTPVSGLSPQTVPGPGSDTLKGDLFPTPSPHMMDVHRFPGPNLSPGPKMGGNFVTVSPNGKPTNPMDLPSYRCQLQSENIPLHPNSTRNSKITHFDPISSLAQMSQQLTNSVASSLNGQGGQNGPGMMNYGSSSLHMIELNSGQTLAEIEQLSGPNVLGLPLMQGPPPSHPHGFHPNSPMGGPIRPLSPKLPGAFSNHMPMPRMMGRPSGPGPNPYNGANVQVKPNAPNTIQYLPAKSQLGNASGPRAPPSLDFLRFANPLSNLDSKMPSQNLQYFANCGGPGGPGGMQQGGPPVPPHMGHMEGPPMPPDGMGGMVGGPMMQGGHMGMGPMLRGPIRPQGGMMRMPSQMGGFPGSNGPPDIMFNPGGPPTNAAAAAQMFVSGPKGSPMGLGAPDATQPLPPSMGQSSSFKNSQFVGPTPADPIYAQQYHNFQQQLYAMTTRNQMGVGGQVMGPGPGPPHTQQPPYFNPK